MNIQYIVSVFLKNDFILFLPKIFSLRKLTKVHSAILLYFHIVCLFSVTLGNTDLILLKHRSGLGTAATVASKFGMCQKIYYIYIAKHMV